MFSLFCEAKFWTLKSEIQIRDTDFGASRYHEKKEINEDDPFQKGKRMVAEKRGVTLTLKNKRPLKLRDALRDLEQHLLHYKVVYCDWRDDSILQMMLSNGLIVNIGISIYSGDVLKVIFDRFLVGKLLSDNICDVVSTRTHLIVSYNENHVTIVHYLKPCSRLKAPEKLAKLEPRVQHVELVGPAGRRLDRKITCNLQADLLLTWWHSSRDEAYPWSPHVQDRDRANIHVYSLSGTRLELLCYHRTEFDPISVGFSRLQPSYFWLIEQRVSSKGDVTVDNSRYQVVNNGLHKISITSIPLQTQVCCHCFSPCEEKLVLGCIDGSLVLFDEGRGISRLVKTAFIPSLVTWHNDGALIVSANERGQMQWFDNGLSCVRAQLLSEDVTPSSLIDLGSYFKSQPTLLSMKWNSKASVKYYTGTHVPSDNFLVLVFEAGPVVVLKLIGGGGLVNELHNTGLTADALIRQYLYWGQTDRAISLLLSLNWNTHGATCLAGLYHVTSHVLQQPLTPDREVQLEASLGSFHVPPSPLTRSTELEYGDQVHDLTRRFFHHLLRYQLCEKAYRLAIDLNDADLFVDLYRCAVTLKDHDMARASRAKLEELVEWSGSSSATSHSCSSSCSCSSSEVSSGEESALPPLPQVKTKQQKSQQPPPPLPDLSRHTRLRESAFFNRNLFSEVFHTIPEERSSDLSINMETETACTSFNDLDFGNSEPLCPDFRPPATQALTPDCYRVSRYPVQTTNIPAFTALPTDNTINDIEKIYDLPKEASRNRTELMKKASSVDNLDRMPDRVRSAKLGSLEDLVPTARVYKRQPPGGGTFYSAFSSPHAKPAVATLPGHTKHKVKFSDTVTQIMFPDISKLSLSNQQPQIRARPSRSPKVPDPAQELADSLPLCLGNQDYLRNFAKHPEQPEEDETNGTIQVIHFGVV